MTSDEIRAIADAVVERLRAGPVPPMQSATLTVEGFAAEIGRSRDWVYDQLRRRTIKRCRCGKPYQIPRSELLRLQNP